jgi:E3 ubiquitin-protein ligase HERC2
VYQQRSQLSEDSFRIAKNERCWEVNYVGMRATDAGGPYRDSVERICSELQSPALPLFIRCPNGRTDSGENRDRFVPRPDSTGALHISLYELVGQLMGMAIRSRNLLNLNLPAICWKVLCAVLDGMLPVL